MLNLITKAMKALFVARDAKGKLGKSWIRSKTLWVNVLAVAGVAITNYLGTEVPEDVTISALAVINFILRLITTEPTGFIE